MAVYKLHDEIYMLQRQIDQYKIKLATDIKVISIFFFLLLNSKYSKKENTSNNYTNYYNKIYNVKKQKFRRKKIKLNLFH